ncbi:hypothetical protein BDZ89DRAFT_1059221 [Hymenopellis radicata]|nr:hypothetical protein BDZ89DRAFT_1059221 [Hymenopellis radicata]
MCITALVSDTTVEYKLASRGGREAGWMAMGFGTEMVGSPMVIMWKNSDGTFTISQREATAEVQPVVVSSPPRVATLQSTLSSASGTDATFVFTIDANGDTEQDIIYAFGSVNPGSSNSDADFTQHLDAGSLQLNLAGTVDTSSSGSTGSSAASGDPPLRSYERLIVAHGIVCTVGFLLLLPFGSLLARYLRTFTPTWYTGHWISQFALAGPVIITGVALGIASVANAGAVHLDDDHKKWGVAIFVLYFVQCGLGAVIHWFKPKGSTGRPPQNYLHAVIGLLLIGLAFYQVRSGYDDEWQEATGRNPLPNGVDIVFWIWVAIVPVLYIAGLLLFLRKQYRQEAEARKGQ